MRRACSFANSVVSRRTLLPCVTPSLHTTSATTSTTINNNNSININNNNIINSRCDMSCAAFAQLVNDAQIQGVQRKNKEQHAAGRHMFETEVLDDISTGGMTPEHAMTIANAALALRVRPTVGTAMPGVLQWMLEKETINKMTAEPLSRVLHACVILHSPLLFDLLLTYLWKVVEMAPAMDPVVCAVVINAYGRSGVKHPHLYANLGARAEQIILDKSITIAHVANVLYSLSRVGYQNAALFEKLQQQCLAMRAQATPLIIASVLDSFATAGVVNAELFDTYSHIMTTHLKQCNAALVTSLINTLVKAKRTETPLFKAACDHAVSIAGSFDSASIARVMESLREANINNEELLGSLATRACKIPQEFRTNEVRQTLETLSGFVLYDPELFPLLGSRLASILRNRGVYDADNVASVLASFAAVHERHEDLIHVGARVLSDSATNMPPRTYINALYAFAVHNVRNDNQRRLVEGCKRQLPLLEAEANKDKTMRKRLDVASKAYFKN